MPLTQKFSYLFSISLGLSMLTYLLRGFGIVTFLPPLVVLQVALFLYDRVAAWSHLAYTAFVIGYDLPLFYTIWRLNPKDDQPVP